MSPSTTFILRSMAIAFAAPFLLGMAQTAAACAEKPAAESKMPTLPPTIDSDRDGKRHAWDRDGDGKPDAWDTNGDGKPDRFDDDGNGKPD